MKNLLFIALLIFICALAFYKYYNIQKSFEYKLDVIGIDGDLSGLFQGRGKISLKYLVTIKNKSEANITFSDLIIHLYYNGYKIAESPKTPDNLKTTMLERGMVVTYTGSIDVLLSGSTVNMGLAALQGSPVKIDYKINVRATIFKIPFNFKGNYIYKK